MKLNIYIKPLVCIIFLVFVFSINNLRLLAQPVLTPITPTDRDGVIVFQAEHTNSLLGNWELITHQHPDFFKGASNDSMLYFTGNATNLGPPNSPLDYTFIAPETGTYQLIIRSSRILKDARNDECNDFYVRLAGDFEPGANTFSKSVLLTDTKHYFSSVPDRQWGWTNLGERRISGENVKRRFFYVLKKGEVYTLTVSGRSKRAIMDYIVLFNTSKATIDQARNAKLAVFASVTDGYLLISVDEDKGSVIKNPDNAIHDEGEEVVLTAEPKPGFRFINWTGSVTSDENPLVINMDSTVSLTANFVPAYTVTIRENTVNGTVEFSPEKEIYDAGETVTFVPYPATGYSFESWHDAGGISGNTVPLEITINRDIELTAYFTLNTYRLYLSANNGVITLNPHSAVYVAGTEVELSATPNEGYKFSGWSGYITGEENPITITMDSIIYVTANFEPITSVSELMRGNLKVYPNPSQGVFTVETGQRSGYTVYTLSGLRLIEGEGCGNFEIDMKGYAKGIYLLEVQTHSGVALERLIVD